LSAQKTYCANIPLLLIINGHKWTTRCVITTKKDPNLLFAFCMTFFVDVLLTVLTFTAVYVSCNSLHIYICNKEWEWNFLQLGGETFTAPTLPVPKTILCIGDSITNGSGASIKSIYSYPSRLSSYLQHIDTRNNNLFDVVNLGVSLTTILIYVTIEYLLNFSGVGGATAQKGLKTSYWSTPQYANSLQYSKNASAVILLFGTNDAKKTYWNENNFIRDYVELINIYRNFKKKCCNLFISILIVITNCW